MVLLEHLIIQNKKNKFNRKTSHTCWSKRFETAAGFVSAKLFFQVLKGQNAFKFKQHLQTKGKTCVLCIKQQNTQWSHTCKLVETQCTDRLEINRKKHSVWLFTSQFYAFHAKLPPGGTFMSPAELCRLQFNSQDGYICVLVAPTIWILTMKKFRLCGNLS